MPYQRITIKDIARVAHLTPSSVSRALNNHPRIIQNLRKMGKLAARTLVDRIEERQKAPQRILVEPHLIIRRSCGYKLKTETG
jgi:DNA-binding LacI/PurR family transcriptional regulator